jgi:predicted PurR-regulated permease PerM
VGYPAVRWLTSLGIAGRSLPVPLAAALTLASIYLAIGLLVAIFIPVILAEAELLSNLNVNELVNTFSLWLQQYRPFLAKLGFQQDPVAMVKQQLIEQLSVFINTDTLSQLFGVVSSLGALVATLFASSFIAFFFLQDPGLVERTFMLLIPAEYEASVKRASTNVRTLLRRYILGLLIQMTCVITLASVGMWLFGVPNGFIVACFAGLTNIIPYVGPLMGHVFSAVVVGSTAFQVGADVGTSLLAAFAILTTVNVLDAAIIQPTIYSSSVKAHPLEIFIVVLVAAQVVGVIGMLIAIPVYTIVRVLVTEFYQDLRRVRDWFLDV